MPNNADHSPGVNPGEVKYSGRRLLSRRQFGELFLTAGAGFLAACAGINPTAAQDNPTATPSPTETPTIIPSVTPVETEDPFAHTVLSPTEGELPPGGLVGPATLIINSTQIKDVAELTGEFRVTAGATPIQRKAFNVPGADGQVYQFPFFTRAGASGQPDRTFWRRGDPLNGGQGKWEELDTVLNTNETLLRAAYYFGPRSDPDAYMAIVAEWPWNNTTGEVPVGSNGTLYPVWPDREFLVVAALDGPIELTPTPPPPTPDLTATPSPNPTTVPQGTPQIQLTPEMRLVSFHPAEVVAALPSGVARGIPANVESWSHVSSLAEISQAVRAFRAELGSNPFDTSSPSVVVNHNDFSLLVTGRAVGPCFIDLGHTSFVDPGTNTEHFFVFRAIDNSANTTDANQRVIVLAMWIGFGNAADSHQYAYDPQGTLNNINIRGGRPSLDIITAGPPNPNTSRIPWASGWWNDASYAATIQRWNTNRQLENIDAPVIGIVREAPINN